MNYGKYIKSTGTHWISNSGSDERGKYKGGAARMAIKDYMDQLIYVNGHTLVING